MPQLSNGLGLSRSRFISGGFVGPLDDYTSGMVSAHSVIRRLLTSYEGSLVRIRRSSDDAEQDIGVTGAGLLDTAAITSFVGANSAYVTTVYDQSGNSRNYLQATAALQPRLVNAGTLETNSGQPAIFNISASDTRLAMAAAVSVRTWITTAYQNAALDYAGLITGTSSIVLIAAAGSGTAFLPSPAGYAYYVNGVDETGGLASWCRSATKCLTVTGAATNEAWKWGSERDISSRFFPGFLHEQVFYSDVTAHRAAVETVLMDILGLS
jgi:hypothetical protein